MILVQMTNMLEMIKKAESGIGQMKLDKIINIR